MRWTSKHFWLVALGAGLVAWPAWGQSSRQYDDSESSISSQQHDDESGTPSSRSGTRSSAAQRNAAQRANQSQFDRDDDQQHSRSTTSRSANSATQPRTRGAQADDRSSERGWFGETTRGRSDRDEQWSDWDSKKDIQEAGVWRASNLIGRTVQNQRGDDLGEIKDIVVDINSGKIRYVAVSHGGALGIGEKLFAVSLDQLAMDQDDDGEEFFVLNIDSDALENAEGFEQRRSWPAYADQNFARSRRAQTATARQPASRANTQMAGQQGERTFQGTFEGYDEDSDQVIVRTSDGRRRVYNVEPNVRVTDGRRRVSLDDLEEGDQLRLSYRLSRDNRTTITGIESNPQTAARTAARTRTQGYNSASYDPEDDDRSSIDERRSSGQLRYGEGSQRNSSNSIRSSSDDTDYGRGVSDVRTRSRQQDESSDDDSSNRDSSDRDSSDDSDSSDSSDE